MFECFNNMKILTYITMRITFLFSLLIMCLQGFSQVESSSSFLRGTASSAGSTVQAQIDGHQVVVQQTIGQSSIIGAAKTENVSAIQGFIQPLLLDKILTPDVPQVLEAKIYPNPFVENLFLEFDLMPETNIVISAFDIMGKVVWSKSYASSNFISLEPTNLTYGYYFFKVECDGMQRVEKILKSK